MAGNEDPKANAAVHMKEYPIASHSVKFPRQPYGAQIVFMQKLISAIHNRSNALLEAPTGCGKTLAILCGALAWQSKAKTEAVEMEVAEELSIQGMALTQGGASQFMTQTPGRDPRGLDDMDTGRLPDEAWSDEDGPKGRPGVPRIYYATRTHSQIAQVANELKITGYSPKMAILGGRKHYCINDEVREAGSNIDEACKDKCTSKGGCKVFDKKRIPHIAAGAPPVHDIEDLVTYGKKLKACPFYMSRDIFAAAELVFCPYNYIVDPAIRSSMKIDLTGAVVIFDEAHNIEDAAREAASTDITLEEVEMALTDTTKHMEDQDVGGLFKQLYGTLAKLRGWMQRFSVDPQEDSRSAKASFEALCRPRNAGPEERKSHGAVKMDGPRLQCVWSGGQIRTHLSEAGLDPASNSDTRECISQAKKMLDERKGDAAPGETADKSGTLALAFLESLMGYLSMVYGMVEQGPDAHAASDYRLVVSSWKEQPAQRARSRFIRQDTSNGKPCVQLSLWCMNPGCAFRAIGEQARSVIVTSGTLSPMVSFASELGIPFPGTPLTTGHVVPQDQVLPMVIAKSPSNHALKATFQDSNTARFQDGVIQALQSIAQVVPDGMLVFMPSYGMLNKLVNHWKESRAWRNLQGVKPVWTEPQGGSAEDLEESIQDYYTAIKEGRGGIFFAVCRGKVSEGINFADCHARAVVLLGIPYPAYKDTKVEQKKAYNDHKDSQARGLVTGTKWYNLQAFRAMNQVFAPTIYRGCPSMAGVQALGRCIRHKQDYGAIILMDERMLERSNQFSLSEWVRKRMGNRAINFDQAHRQLDEFFKHCQHKLQSMDDGADVKDEKSLLKDEKLLLKDEKPLLKDEQLDVKEEKVAVKDEKEALDATAAEQSTQEMWTRAPAGNQRITLAQALPSTAALQSNDAAIEPKLEPKLEPKQEEQDTAQGEPVCPKPEQHVLDAASTFVAPKPEPAEDDDLQLLRADAPPNEGVKTRGGGRPRASSHGGVQTTLQAAFAAPRTAKRKPGADSGCSTPEPPPATPSEASAEQNSAPNGQLGSAVCAARDTAIVGHMDSHIEVSLKPEPSHTEQPVLQPHHTARQACPHAPLLDVGLQGASIPPSIPPVGPSGHPAPWPAAQTLQGGTNHACTAATVSPSLPATHSQMLSPAQPPATLGDHPLTTVPGNALSILPCGVTANNPGSSHWAAAQQSSWPGSSVAAPIGACQPPSKAQKLSPAAHIEPAKPSNAPALHPDDAQLLESGFLDSDSEEDAAQAAGVGAQHTAAPALDMPFGNVANVAQRSATPPVARGQAQYASTRHWMAANVPATPGNRPPGMLPGSASPSPSTMCRSPYAAAAHTDPGQWIKPWQQTCLLLCQHDTKIMEEVMGRGMPAEHRAALQRSDVHRALLTVLQEARINAACMSSWCSEQLQRRMLPVGVAMAVRHADKAQHCTELHHVLDSILCSTNVVVADELVRKVLGPLKLPKALEMLHGSYKGILDSARGQSC